MHALYCFSTIKTRKNHKTNYFSSYCLRYGEKKMKLKKFTLFHNFNNEKQKT